MCSTFILFQASGLRQSVCVMENTSVEHKIRKKLNLLNSKAENLKRKISAYIGATHQERGIYPRLCFYFTIRTCFQARWTNI